MNKNVKKMVTLCLYSIALSAHTAAICCLKRDFDSILNKNEASLPSQANINEIFGSINSMLQNQNFNNSINDESIQFNQIHNDSQLSKKRKIMEITNLLNTESNEEHYASNQDKNINNEKGRVIKKNGKEYIKIDLAAIDTPQKYNDIARNLPERKRTLAIIGCPECDSTSSGSLGMARRNLGLHRQMMHGIKYQPKKKLPNLNKNMPKIELKFSSINTKEQYNATASKLSEGKQTLVIVKCPGCKSKREGELFKVRGGINNHVKTKHPDLFLKW